MLLTITSGLLLVAVTVFISYTISRVFWSSKHGQSHQSGRYGMPFGGGWATYGGAVIGAAITAMAGSHIMSDSEVMLAFLVSLISGLIAAVVGVCHSPPAQTKPDK